MRLYQKLLILPTFALLIAGTFLFSHYYKISAQQQFPISIVRIYNAQHVNHQVLQEALKPLVQQGFFMVDVDLIKDRLLQLPWVEDVVVRRIWPDRVEVNIVERNPVARWGGTSLLSASGEIFYPPMNTYPTLLPQFIGPDGKHILMMQYYYEMNRTLSPLHARIAYLELTPYLSWTVTLDNGIKLRIGHKDTLTRLAHFVKVYPKIIGGHADGVDYVDLRYSNGVAIRWKVMAKI